MGRIAACPEVVQYERRQPVRWRKPRRKPCWATWNTAIPAQQMASLREPDRLVSFLRDADKLAEASLTLVRLVERLSKLRPGEAPGTRADHAAGRALGSSPHDVCMPELAVTKPSRSRRPGREEG